MKYGFGIDIGGTSVKLGLFSEDGILEEKWEVPTRKENGGSLILTDVAAAVADCLRHHKICHEQVFGLGVGVPGPVDEKSTVNHCVNLGWGVVNLAEVLGALTGFRTVAGNDANMAALGECWRGGGRGHRSMVLATLGTGIGGGIVVDGKVLTGAHGVGGEIGHIPMEKNETRLCTCGKRGCAEQYGSATGMVRMAEKFLKESAEPSVLRRLHPITAKDIFDAGAGGDNVAQRIMEEFFDFLGRMIAMVCCVVDPEVVVLGGGVSKAGPVLLDGVRRHFIPEMFRPGRGIEFTLAELGNDAGMYGAFKLALDTFIK